MPLYPLTFRPLLSHAASISSGKLESSSEIANGPLAGRSLKWALGEFGRKLTGDIALTSDGRFPVVVRNLDVAQDLAWVYPLPADDISSLSALYILRADPGARLATGLRAGTTARDFLNALASGTAGTLLSLASARSGACHGIPAGNPSALSGGVVAIEVAPTAGERPVVIDLSGSSGEIDPDALAAIDRLTFPAVESVPQARSHVAGFFTTVSRLLVTPHFTMEKVRFTEGVEEAVPYDQAVLWIMLEGRCEVHVEGVRDASSFASGDTVLLPAMMKKPVLKTKTDCVWIELTFPIG